MLSREIEEKRRDIKTDSYPMSIGEIISIYIGGELELHPDFQRFFRWSIQQKTNLIESIMLGIPIPSVFVSQRTDGVWDVIDGLQRLSTILQFVGVLKDENGNVLPPLCLAAGKYLPSLRGKYWEKDDDQDQESSLSTAERILIKRAKLGINIVLRESDENTKYDLFERLNTGGSQLSEQEVRNCVLIMKSKGVYTWLKQLSQNENFQNCVSLSDRLTIEQYDVELATRFIVLKSLGRDDLSHIADLTTFLTERILSFADSVSSDGTVLQREKEVFEKTFSLLWAATGEDSFRRYDKQKGKFLGAFLVSAFEAIALGLGHNVAQWSEDNAAELKQRIIAFGMTASIGAHQGRESAHRQDYLMLFPSASSDFLEARSVIEMKVRSREELLSAIDFESAWRKREISILDGHVNKYEPLARSGYVILYAHWEGMVKSSSIYYLTYVEYRIKSGKSVPTKYKALSTISSRCYGRSVLSSVREIVTAASSTITSNMPQSEHIKPKLLADTKSNLNFSTLSDLLFLVDIQDYHFSTKQKFIDEELLEKRNAIAHGERTAVTSKDFSDAKDSVIDLIETFRNCIHNSTTQFV